MGQLSWLTLVCNGINTVIVIVKLKALGEGLTLGQSVG